MLDACGYASGYACGYLEVSACMFLEGSECISMDVLQSACIFLEGSECISMDVLHGVGKFFPTLEITVFFHGNKRKGKNPFGKNGKN